MVHWVATLGSVVLKARNAEEAIALLDEHPDIQLLITDIRMPGSMDGLRLAHYVRERWPPIKIIVVSGMIDTSQSALPKRSVFIPKPGLVGGVVVFDPGARSTPDGQSGIFALLSPGPYPNRPVT